MGPVFIYVVPCWLLAARVHTVSRGLVSITFIAFSLNNFHFWTIWLIKLIGAAAERRHSFAQAIARSDTKTTPQTIGSRNRCHAPSKTSGLYLRPDVYFFEMLANPRLLNETGVYLREASIREYTLYSLHAVIAIFYAHVRCSCHASTAL